MGLDAAAMNAPLFVGLDVGTQGTKGLLVDAERGLVVARASSSYGLIEGLGPGACEQHPDTWWAAVRDVVAALFAEREHDRARVGGVGVSGQQHGLVVLDEQLRVLRPAQLWCDTTCALEARELSQRLERPIPCGFTAPKILWLARHEPELFARVRALCLPHDWINLRLTGARTAEAGDASGTGFFDSHTRAYDLDAARAIDARVPEMLSPLVAADQLAGRLSPQAARELGLAAGVPVSAGSGDNMLSALGAGATRPGVAVLSLGTSATVSTFSCTPLLDPTGAIAPFCDATGAYLPLLCVMNATGVTEEVRRAFASEHATLARAAARVEAGARGVLWLPYLNGERVPDWPHASGVIAGLRTGSLDAGLLYRAAIEGVALNLAWGIERMRAHGVSIESARLVGGASRNELWGRILADVLEIPLVRLVESESGALGAALQAMWAVRRAAGEDVSADTLAQAFVRCEPSAIEPDERVRSVYRDASARFREWAGRAFG